ncbi:hypothetical protein P5673_016023 [Acropora cervicornis]|uniref:Uncharacterized protein n=1 Tax=Acropora cervicornis TaxID=6130 RepID=A0AAD9QGJ3_ACRCE|nr:hypothetical protein P5673_016023 [Acropora cervicornis]
MTVELSEMTFTLVVEVVEGDSSILRSSVRPLLADLRVGVAEVSFEDFGDGGPPRFRAGDRDLERDLGLAGDLDLRRPGLRDGEDERERKRPSLCNERRRNMLPHQILRDRTSRIYYRRNIIVPEAPSGREDLNNLRRDNGGNYPTKKSLFQAVPEN